MAIVTIRGRVDEISPVYRKPKPRQQGHLTAPNAPSVWCEVTDTCDEVRMVISEVNPDGTYDNEYEVFVQDSLAMRVHDFPLWRAVDEIRVRGLLRPGSRCRVDVHSMTVRVRNDPSSEIHL